ncbi:putative peptidyl-prolyl cis-trans isomerase [Planctomycetes bacterium MalM25]|nr:putative peptidyl-prolyl cis-trans isomerase [Planctomycetes bacterium MalM25]
MRRFIGWLVLASVTAVAVPLSAQEAAAPAAPATPEKAAYLAALEAYKDQVREIESLWAAYQATGDKTEQETINEQLKPVVAEAKIKVNAMVDAALEAFKAAPMSDKEVTDLLLSVAEHQAVGRGEGGGGDQYETAVPILEALVDGGHDKAELPVWGALAAICVNDFDLADKFAALAEKSGALRAGPGGDEAAQETFATALRFIEDRARYRARWEKEQKVREAEAAADNNPRVKLKLNKGDVVIELFEDQAPIATANFLSLVKKGFYEGVVFHRVLPRFMAQGGDPTGSGSGGPGYSIACECEKPDARGHFRGTLSMAHAGKDTGGSQFFLCFVPTDFLDGRHTAFGRVVEGFDVIGDIQVIDPGKNGPQPDVIEKAEVLRDRGHAYEFDKLPGR